METTVVSPITQTMFEAGKFSVIVSGTIAETDISETKVSIGKMFHAVIDILHSLESQDDIKDLLIDITGINGKRVDIAVICSFILAEIDCLSERKHYKKKIVCRNISLARYLQKSIGYVDRVFYSADSTTT